MKNKYADLIKKLEEVTAAYDEALHAAKEMRSVIDGFDDVLGAYGPVDYFDGYDISQAIHITSGCFTPAAIDCGHDFKVEYLENYTRFECTMFGYRVFALFIGNELGFAELEAKSGN